MPTCDDEEDTYEPNVNWTIYQVLCEPRSPADMIARVHMCITAVKLTADKSLNDIVSDFQNHQGVVTHIHMLAKKSQHHSGFSGVAVSADLLG